MKANVYVTLKPGVLDPQGRAVHKTMGQLGLDGVEAVRVGKFIELELTEDSEPEAMRERISAMCDQLLANPVIEDYRVEIVE